MVRLRQKLDSAWKIYVPKILREAGFDREIEIAPNTSAAVMYPAGASLPEVLESLRIITQDIEHCDRLAQTSMRKRGKRR